MTAASEMLRELAQRVADDLPPTVAEEVVLTGSVSRGVADAFSDIEMLVVTRDALGLDDCFALARGAGLAELGTWGAPHPTARRVSGIRDAVPVELIWWPRDHAEAQVEALLAGDVTSTADALAHGVALRTGGLLAGWQERLRAYPPELAAAQIEEAALRWGGFAPAGLLTLVRAGDRLALVEWILDAALRVLTIVFALNRVWPPTTKRLAARTEALAIKPHGVAERIEEALTEPDPRRALLVMTQLQLDTVRLAPGGPHVDRARTWLARGIDVRAASRSSAGAESDRPPPDPYPSASEPDPGGGRMEGTLYDWAQDAVGALGLPDDARWVADKETVQWVLDFAREVAQGVARPGAPVGAFLAGIAVGRNLDAGPQALEQVRAALEPTFPTERAQD